MAQNGWNVVVSNHRGLGGISITSDCFYNAGWTDDIRKVIDHIHCLYSEAPLFAEGTSIGANILVKYLGKDGILIFLLLGLLLYVLLGTYWQQSILSRLADWEGIIKSRSVRDFDT